MKVKELIKLAKQKSFLFYGDLEVEELLQSTNDYKRNETYFVNIASRRIVNKSGNQIGYIDYNTTISQFPKIGEVILMHDKYVGKIKEILFNNNTYDAIILIDTAYIIDDIDENNLLKYPTFNAGTYIK